MRSSVRRLVLAAAVATTTLTVPAAALAAPAASTSPPQPVVDSTNTFRVSISPSWTIATEPIPFWGFWEVVPLAEYPSIQAWPVPMDPATDDAGSSLVVQAFPLSDHGEVLESFYGDYGVDCDPAGFGESAFTSSDGSLVGQRYDFFGCYDYVRNTVIADYGTNYTIAVDYFAATPQDAAAFSGILASLAPTGNPLPAPIPIATPSTAVTFPWADFRAVPRLGAEGVRGTGCGSAGQLGDVIPDGWWAGFPSTDGSGYMGIDVVCVFSGEGAQQALRDNDDNILDASTNFLIVSNSDRVRTMPINPDNFGAYLGGANADGTCTQGELTDPAYNSGTLAWVHIASGMVDYTLYECPREWAAPPERPSNLPPAYPTGDAFSVWPYGEFWNVPQLGTEPVRGSGCGADGNLGNTIPDGLWAGYLSLDPSTDQLWVDLVCIYYGATAQQVLADGSATIVSAEPDYLIVNSNTQRRAVPNNLQTVLTSGIDGNGRCVPMGSSMGPGDHMTAPITEIDTYTSNQAWIRIDGGVATWAVYGCDTGFEFGG